jgi:hypothetical protein
LSQRWNGEDEGECHDENNPHEPPLGARPICRPDAWRCVPSVSVTLLPAQARTKCAGTAGKGECSAPLTHSRVSDDYHRTMT